MKILMVEDHGVVREGIRRLLTSHFDMMFFEATDVEAAFEVYRRERPDLILLDLNLEGASGLELLRRLQAADDDPRILIFSMHSEPAYAARALKAGARGYVSKSAPVEELIKAVREVAGGSMYVDKDLAAALAASNGDGEDPLRGLSVREMEILRLLGQGKSMTMIADMLGIAYKTVANNCSMMKTKLGVERTADLIRLAVRNLES